MLLCLGGFRDVGGLLVMGVYGRSSSALACLSEENGVLISRAGLCCRCLAMRLNLARGGARANSDQ